MSRLGPQFAGRRSTTTFIRAAVSIRPFHQHVGFAGMDQGDAPHGGGSRVQAVDDPQPGGGDAAFGERICDPGGVADEDRRDHASFTAT